MATMTANSSIFLDAYCGKGFCDTYQGTPLDVRDPWILAMAAAQRHFLEAEYDEYATTNASGAAFCCFAALIESSVRNSQERNGLRRMVQLASMGRACGGLARDDKEDVIYALSSS